MRTLYPALVMQEIDILAQLRFTFVLSFLFLLSCTELSEYDRTQVREALSDSLISSTNSRNVSIEFFEENRLKLIITANEASNSRVNGEQETRLNGDVNIDIFNEELKKVTQVRSDRAIYYPKVSEFELFGDVWVVNEDSSTLSSEYLKWERKTGLINTPEFVIIVTKTDSITGSQFSGKSDLSEYTIIQGSGTTTINN